MTDEVVVFHQAGCPFAARLRARPTLARIPYRSVRFAEDEVGLAAVPAHHEQGWEVAPTVLVEGRYLSNPSLSDVQERWPRADPKGLPARGHGCGTPTPRRARRLGHATGCGAAW